MNNFKHRVRPDSKEFDKLFPIIPASKLTLKSEFMKHKVNTWRQRNLKKMIEEAIQNGASDFRIAQFDPSFDSKTNSIFFAENYFPAIEKTAEFFEKEFKELYPEKHSRMACKTEYVLFLAYIMDYLVSEKCWETKDAWKLVCEDSRKAGNYQDTCIGVIMENTGKTVLVDKFADLANTSKIILEDGLGEPSTSKFLIVSGSFKESGKAFPLAEIQEFMYPDAPAPSSTGLFVCDP